MKRVPLGSVSKLRSSFVIVSFYRFTLLGLCVREVWARFDSTLAEAIFVGTKLFEDVLIDDFVLL